MSTENVVEEFQGVYLLYCTNPKYKGRTYIGYTVNPNRRIKQHNKGKQAGGAWRTSNKGPWEMVLIIHGFPNEISALRFEWAWQHPDRSRRLRHVQKKKGSEKMYDYCLRILSEMLRVGPWHRLALTVRWLMQEYARDFPIDRRPPLHIPLTYGPVVSKKVSAQVVSPDNTDISLLLCSLCYNTIQNGQQLTCLNPDCLLMVHIICLASQFLQTHEVLPVQGECPSCGLHVLWADLVRKKKGCYTNLTETCENV